MTEGEDESDDQPGIENPGFDPPETPDREPAVVDHGASSIGPDAPTTPPTSGAPGDEEMPLARHIEEMVKRLSIVLIIAGGIAALAFPFGEEISNFLWYSFLPETAPPVLYKPLELILTQMKVASLVGLIAALPVFVYETYLFMRPGLFPHERRYYLAAIPTSLVLAFVGLVFAYFVVIPTVFTYFLEYTRETAQVAFALGQTMDLILILMAYLALVFQIPLFVMLAMMMGLVTREWLVGRRLLFWGGFAGISFIFSPDPTGMSPILIALTMVVLFEGTLLLAKWTGRGKRSGWS